MRKIFIFSILLFLWSCATPLEYDHTKFSISPDVKLLNINTSNTIRERDGQMLVQVSGSGSKNQSVYYKIEWFDVNGMNISTKLAQWKKSICAEMPNFSGMRQLPPKEQLLIGFISQTI